MNEIIEEFRQLIPVKHKRTAKGWITFNCPACGDRRGRGALLETASGGFRYRCMNGGCDYENPTGWEPENGFFGRPRRLFLLMGGSIEGIPKTLLDPTRPALKSFDMADPNARSDWVAYMMSEESEPAYRVRAKKTPADEDLATEFPKVDLPENSILLWNATTKDALDVQKYVINRGKFFIDRCPFTWSPRYKRHVIIPFIDNHKIIGWIARKIDPGKDFAHVKCPNFPSDYMLNQHLRFRYKTVLVVEGTFDALALSALCTFGNVISKKQINLLNHLKESGKRVALLPDFQKEEWRSYWQSAKEHGWHLCVPEWPGDDGYSVPDYIKDPCDSIMRNGLLYTMDVVMKSITLDYDYAEQLLLRRSR